MKRLLQLSTLLLMITALSFNAQAQYMQIDFTQALTAGNEGGGTIISNAGVTVDTNYVSSTLPVPQKFTFLSTNNIAANISITGDGVMRMKRVGSGTIYVVKNDNFSGPPSAVMVSFDFNADTTSGTSNTAIQVMIGQNFTNSNVEPALADKYARFYIGPKSPTGTPGAWAVSATGTSSTSSFNSTQKITWILNRGTESKIYTAPGGSTDTVASNKYDLYVGNVRELNDVDATTAAALMEDFEIRIGGGSGTYSIDNLLIQDIPASGTAPTVTTGSITDVTATSAGGGGTVTDSGSASVTARGVVWSTNQNPTTADNKTEDGTGTGSFTSTLTGLTASTMYYVRAYATNSAGTAYGNEVSFTTSAAAPVITLASTDPAVPAGSINISSERNIIYRFTLAVTTANAQLTSVTFNTTGTFAGSDWSAFSLFYNTTDDFATASQLGTSIVPTVRSWSFSNLTQTITAGATGYFWITVNVPANAVSGNTIGVAAITGSNLTFASGTATGTAFAGGLQTIIGGSLPNDFFRSVTSGTWNNAATWESSSDGNSWIAATRSPDSASAGIYVRPGHSINVVSSVIVDQLLIDTTAVVVVEGSPVVLTIANGPTTPDAEVRGTLKVTGTAIASPGPFSVSLSTDAVLAFASTGVYEHNQNAGSIPVSVWNNGSTLKLTGIIANSPSNGNQNFYNIIWDCPAQTGNLNLGWNGNTIGGDITVVNTNTGRWQFCAPTTNTSATVTIMGDVYLLAGNLTTNGTGNGGTTIIIDHYGDIIVTGGNLSIARGSQGGTGTSDWILHNGNFTMSNAATQNSNALGARFRFSGTNPQYLTLSNITFTGGMPVIVDSGATLHLGNSVIGSSGLFTVNATAALGTSMALGIDENLLTTGTKTLSTEATYIYNGTAGQITGLLLPVTVKNLVLDNGAGVSLSADVAVTDTLKIMSGFMNLNGKNVQFGTTGALHGAAGTTVKGLEGGLFASRDLNAPSALNAAGLGAVVTSAANPGVTQFERYQAPKTGNNNSSVFRSYRIAPANNTGLNATLRFYYDQSELTGLTERNLIVFRSETGLANSWIPVGGTVDTNNNYVEVSGVNTFAYFTLADSALPIPVELTSFAVSVSNNRASLRWSTASETNNKGFEVERLASKPNSSWEKIGFVPGSGNSAVVKNYSFSDNTRLSGKYTYRLKQIDFDGTFSYGPSAEADFGVPAVYGLSQNYPNPFNPSTTVEFQLPEVSKVTITLYDILGNEVMILLNETKEAGFHSVNVDLHNMSNGVYYYKMSAGSFSQVKKMILIK